MAPNAQYSISKLAGLCQVSSRQLNRYCCEAFGVSAGVWLAGMRMEQAKRLLVEFDGHIGRVARKLGYKHATNFTRKFKVATGETPTEFLSRNAKNTNMSQND